MDVVTGKTIVIMGVANKSSIAWGCAQAIQENGGQVILTYQNERIKRSLERFVPEEMPMIQCDVSDEETVFKPLQRLRTNTATSMV